MGTTYSSYLNLYQFTPGRLLFALSDLQAALTPAEAAEMQGLIDAARAAGERQLSQQLV